MVLLELCETVHYPTRATTPLFISPFLRDYNSRVVPLYIYGIHLSLSSILINKITFIIFIYQFNTVNL